MGRVTELCQKSCSTEVELELSSGEIRHGHV